jgi:glycosyltransferase involved in cell wall biosynthesis
VAGSPRLGQHLERLHPTVRMIEQAVGPQYWTVKPKKHTGLHIFWMGMHDNIIYFSEVDPVLEVLAQRHEFTVHFCTSKRSGLDHGDGFKQDNVARIAAKKYPTMFHEWSVDGALEVMATCDLGIAPLFHNEWCWCKCANKAVNMMAAGLPVVVSDVPSYRAAIEDGVTGRLCYGPEEWETALEELLGDAKQRKAMAKAGKKAAGEFKVEVIAKQWSDFLTEVA